jgi:outer membrane protein assembly factor BamD (BamD/ComL family)
MVEARVRSSTRWAVLLALAMTVTASHDDARGDDPTKLSSAERTRRSRALYDLGRSQFNVADYAAAMKSFSAAYEYRPLPLFLYNLGQVALAAGEQDKALHFFERFLIEDPNAPEAPEVRVRLAALRSRPAPKVEAVPAPEAPPPPAPAPATPPPMLAPTPTVVAAAPAAPSRPRRLGRGAWAGIGVGIAVVVGGVATALALTVGRSGPPSTTWGNHVLSPRRAHHRRPPRGLMSD